LEVPEWVEVLIGRKAETKRTLQDWRRCGKEFNWE